MFPDFTLQQALAIHLHRILTSSQNESLEIKSEVILPTEGMPYTVVKFVFGENTLTLPFAKQPESVLAQPERLLLAELFAGLPGLIRWINAEGLVVFQAFFQLNATGAAIVSQNDWILFELMEFNDVSVA